MDTNEQRPSKITLVSRKELTLEGVTDILFFDDAQLTVDTSQGILTVEGADLHIVELSLDNGTLLVSGTVDALCYTSDKEKKKRSLFGRKA